MAVNRDDVGLNLFLLCLSHPDRGLRYRVIKPGSVLVENINTSCTFTAEQIGALWLHNLMAFPQRQGYGTETLAHFCESADRSGTVLKLVAAPYGADPMTRRQLTAWYAKFGFHGSYGTLTRWPYCRQVSGTDRSAKEKENCDEEI